MEQSSLEETLNHWRLELEEIPANVHILCPRISNEDSENYSEVEPTSGITPEEKAKRIADGTVRINVTLWNSLLFGVDRKKVESWVETYASRLQAALSSCDSCIKNWHQCRKAFLTQLAVKYSHDIVSALERLVIKFDHDRLDSHFKWSRQKIEALHVPNKPFKLSSLGPELSGILLNIYESLCCVTYLRSPEKRPLFKFVFDCVSGGKKPLRLGANVLLPAMTEFLFDDDPTCHRFALAAWGSLTPSSMSAEQFEWAVSQYLVDASSKIGAVDPMQPGSFGMISQFWTGVLAIMNAMNQEILTHNYRALQDRPNLYDLVFMHMAVPSEEVLLLVLDAFCLLINKAPTAFWSAISNPRAFAVIEPIFAAPMIRILLNKTMELGLNRTGLHRSIAWITVWSQSLTRDQRADASESLLHLLFGSFLSDGGLNEAGRTACIRAGLETLSELIDSYLNPSTDKDMVLIQYLAASNNLVFVNNALNIALKYSDIIVNAAEKKSSVMYEHESAAAVIEKALILDTRTYAAEHRALLTGAQVQQMVTRKSALLWEAFLDLMHAGNISLATMMLKPLITILPVDQFRHERKATKPMAAGRVSFNQRFLETSAVIGRFLQRLCDFERSEIATLGQDSHLRTLLAMMLHGEEEISLAATELIKTITGESSRSEAMLKLITERPTPVIRAFTVAINTTAKAFKNKEGVEIYPAWNPMRNILHTAKDVITGLFDPAVGVLRSRTLSRSDLDSVHAWWRCQWHYVQVCFDATQYWSFYIEIRVLTDFCREVIELAEALSSNDGVLSSASKTVMLATAAETQKPGDPTPEMSDSEVTSAAMTRVLDPCRSFLIGLVRMIRLKDEYLVEITVKIIVKLLNRLTEYSLPIPDEVREYIEKAARRRPDGKYGVGTKLSSQQKAELLRAACIDIEDEPIITAVVPIGGAGAGRTGKVQAKLDMSSWAKSGGDDISPSLTPGLSANKDLLASFAAKHEAKAKASTTVAKPSAAMQAVQALRNKSAEQSAAVQARHAAQVKAKQSALKEARQKEREEMARKRAEFIARDRAARGIVVKEKSEIMVESSESESDDDDDGESSLVQSSKAGMDALNEAERRRERALQGKIRGPVKKIKIQRTAKDNRARLMPAMDSLHAEILSWDIFHDGDAPPSGLALTHVENSYPQPVAYKQTFMPLLIYEAWRSFVTDKSECTAKTFGIKIMTRMTVDRFLEITTTMPSRSEAEINGGSRERQVAEGDIVLLSKGEKPLDDSISAHCLARIWRVTFKKDVLEVTWRLNHQENKLARELMPGTSVNAVRITNMTTIEREYAALEALQYYDLMDEILKAEPSPILRYSDEQVQRYMSNWQLNAGQAKAVLGAKDNDGFTLIQGPPGTGKTKTIVAMVGCLLTGTLGSGNNMGGPQPIKSFASTLQPIGSIGAGMGNRPAASPQPAMQKKLLVCAPSNAAVDELVLRLKQGVKTTGGQTHPITVIRLGRSDAINAAVKDVTLDEMVKAKLEGDKTKQTALAERDKLHGEAAQIKEELNLIRPQLEAARAGGDRSVYSGLQRKFDELKFRQTRIGAKIDADRDAGNTVAREVEMRRRMIQQQILDGAQVICATLSGSGHDMFRNLSNIEFETVIIDEAAQCVELSALIPLKYGAAKCILVGDPKQLPPTVLSQSAQRYGYDQSLFVRMQTAHPDDVYLLDTQYRMHPHISAFPAREFYDSRLLDGGDMGALRKAEWHSSVLLSPYRFFDIRGVQARGRGGGGSGGSLVNVKEIEAALQLVRRVRADYSGVDFSRRIGVITPYKAQLSELRFRFSREFGEGILAQMEFNTTDAFQGRECDIIIFSCVRASPTGGIGFMTDIRRMNVGLTRAKQSLWILGDATALKQGEYWRRLIEDVQRRKLFTEGDIVGMLRKPSVRGELPIEASGDFEDSKPISIPIGHGAPPRGPRNAVYCMDERGVPVLEGPRDVERPPVIQQGVPQANIHGKKRAGSHEDNHPRKRPGHSGPMSAVPSIPGGPQKGLPSRPPPNHKPNQSSGGSLSAQMMRKTHHQQQRAPVDPSAMEVMGLAPPRRPPPVGPPAAGNTSNGPRPKPPPRKKAAVDPFIKKRPGPRR